MSEGFNVSAQWRRSGKVGQEQQTPGPQKTGSASQAGQLNQPGNPFKILKKIFKKFQTFQIFSKFQKKIQNLKKMSKFEKNQNFGYLYNNYQVDFCVCHATMSS